MQSSTVAHIVDVFFHQIKWKPCLRCNKDPVAHLLDVFFHDTDWRTMFEMQSGP